MLTVVLLNWARPENVLRNIGMYAGFSIVKQVICFNNGAPLACDKLPPKAVLIEASQDVGLYSRFAAASLATTEAVLHTDDDLFVPEPTLSHLYHSWLQRPGNCHGLYGRSVHQGYDPRDAFGEVEVVLTRALVCSRRISVAASHATPRFEDLACEPVGNGEDIILSFAAMADSRQPNRSYPLPHVNYPGFGGKDDAAKSTAIHLRWPGHRAHRGRVVERCREVFGLKAPLCYPAAGGGKPLGQASGSGE